MKEKRALLEKAGAKLLCGCGCVESVERPCLHVKGGEPVPIPRALEAFAAAGALVGEQRHTDSTGGKAKGKGGEREKTPQEREKLQRQIVQSLRTLQAQSESEHAAQSEAERDSCISSQMREAVRAGLAEWEAEATSRPKSRR